MNNEQKQWNESKPFNYNMPVPIREWLELRTSGPYGLNAVMNSIFAEQASEHASDPHFNIVESLNQPLNNDYAKKVIQAFIFCHTKILQSSKHQHNDRSVINSNFTNAYDALNQVFLNLSIGQYDKKAVICHPEMEPFFKTALKQNNMIMFIPLIVLDMEALRLHSWLNTGGKPILINAVTPLDSNDNTPIFDKVQLDEWIESKEKELAKKKMTKLRIAEEVDGSANRFIIEEFNSIKNDWFQIAAPSRFDSVESAKERIKELEETLKKKKMIIREVLEVDLGPRGPQGGRAH